jgi:lipooligosaccharide transport system permease protein
MVGNLTEPFLYLLALGYGLGGLVAEIQGMSYIQFIAPGLVVSASMYAATFEGTYGTYTRLVPQHTFEGILSTPVGVAEIAAGDILHATVKATAAGCAVLVVVAAFGLVHSPMALLVPILALVCGILFGSMAVLVAGLSPSYDFFNYYFTLAVTPMFLFSGIFFPLSQLPAWAQSVAWFSPLTHAANISRALFTGQVDVSIALDAVWLTVAALLPYYPAVFQLRRRLIQ